jgi:two-component system, OmpR family, sensor histidine kinase BaeS
MDFLGSKAWKRIDLFGGSGYNKNRKDNTPTRHVANLLQNAWQYTPPGGTFRIYTETLPGLIKVVFANTGGELAEKDLPFIFERFYRGEKSRSREHGGAGIGLAIVKELIEAHNGRVGAEMSGEEIRIWFTLPV